MTRAVILAVVAVAGLVGVVSWRAYAVYRLGRIEVTNDGPPLIAQLLPESGDEPLGEPFDVVTRSTLSLPGGDYRLRVHGVGRLGRAYRLAVNPGETRAHALSLDEGRLLGRESSVQIAGQQKLREEPIPFVAVTVAVALTPGKADLIERTPRALVRRDGITGKAVWEVTRGPDPLAARREPTNWVDHLLALSTRPDSCRLVEPASDLDSDGTADLIWAFQNFNAFLAVSGKDGSVLWDFTAAPDDPGGPRPAGPDLRSGPNANRMGFPGHKPEEPGGRWRQVIGRPATADGDGDGTPDLIATMAFSETEEEIARRTGVAPGPNPAGQQAVALQRRFIVAVSGRSGQALWSRPLDEAFATLSPPARQRPAEVVPAKGWVALAIDEGDRWVGLDAATGRPRAGPVDLGFAPVRPVQYADLDGDGDGEPEILALGPGQAAGQLTLAAFSMSSGRGLWTAPVHAKYEPLFGVMGPPEWPLVVDLDGDGRPEVAVPDSGPMPPGSGYRGLRLLDGASGQTRWSRPMRPETLGGDGLVEVLGAPDLDGDGVRDLVATSFFLGRSPTSPNEGSPPIPERAYVDALSGRDGRPLWWWNRDLPTDKVSRVLPLRWWGRGPDGWPLLAVGLGGQDPQGIFNASAAIPPIVHNLEASTGRDVATAVGLASPGVADLDGDGLLDLWGEAGGQLQAFRGEAPEAWRALGLFGPAEPPRSWSVAVAPPAADLDGDGIADVLSTDLRTQPRTPKESIASHALEPAFSQGFPSGGAPGASPPGSRTAVARSGRDGRVIWKAALDESWAGLGGDPGETTLLTAPPLPSGDLDGDGTPDVIAQTTRFGVRPGGFELKHAATLPLRALSGRSGRRLWSAGPLPLGFRAFGDSQVNWARTMIIEPVAAPDLLVGHSSPFAPTAPPSPGPNSPAWPHLARVSGRTGRLLWDMALTEENAPQGRWSSPEPGFGDVDGDGTLDVVSVVPTSSRPQEIGCEVRAVSLRDGRLLWVHHLDFQPGPIDQPELVVADLDGDGRAEVVVSDRPDAGGRPGYALKALDGRDGQVRWTFRADPEGPQQVRGWLFLADLDGQGRPSACLGFIGPVSDAQGVRRIVVLDPQGRVRANRDLSGPLDNAIRSTGSTLPRAVDLTGDRRDEIFFFSRHRLRVWGPDLDELWSRQEDTGQVDRIVPGTARQPTRLLLSHPVLALDGADGRPRWAGYAPHSWWGQFQPQLLDPGGPARQPLLISHDLGATTCRRAIPTTPEGSYEPPRGSPVPPGLARNDPRWTRPLPWVELAGRYDIRSAGLAAAALALLNVGLPLALLRLVAGRSLRSLRLVMALPAAAAIPLIAFVTLEPSIPAPPAPLPSSLGLLILLGSLVGVPILACPALAGWALARRRWHSLLRLAGLTALATLAVGAAWPLWDRRTMPPIEHYNWAGWYWAIAPGAFVASVLVLVGWSVRGAIHLFATRR